MRAVVQRVTEASVTVGAEEVGRIGKGFLVLLGVGSKDSEIDAQYMAEKIAKLRVFEDDEGKMNLSVGEIGGSILAVSQFTLYADARKGNRPSFIDAAQPERAEFLYQFFIAALRRGGVKVETGRFGAMMKVGLVNDGPVTIMLDSNKTF